MVIKNQGGLILRPTEDKLGLIINPGELIITMLLHVKISQYIGIGNDDNIYARLIYTGMSNEIAKHKNRISSYPQIFSKYHLSIHSFIKFLQTNEPVQIVKKDGVEYIRGTWIDPSVDYSRFPEF